MPRTCPACLNTGHVWDFVHRFKITCTCQYTTAPTEHPKAA